MLIQFHVFDFCTCANIKRVPEYKETDPEVQFTNNRVSVPALINMYNVCVYYPFQL